MNMQEKTDLKIDDSIPSTSKELVTSWLNTQTVTLETVECNKSDKIEKSIQSTSACILEKVPSEIHKTDKVISFDTEHASAAPELTKSISSNLATNEVTGNSTYDDIVTILRVLEEDEKNNTSEFGL